MPRKKKSEERQGPSISIGGNVGGSVAVGDHNVQVGNTGQGSTVIVGGKTAQQTFSPAQQASLSRPLTPEEVASLTEAFDALDRRIEEAAPEGKKEAAREQVEQMKEAVAEGKPDVPALSRAKAWFVDNLPALLGTVTSLLTHPLVGKLVEAGGEFTLSQFRRRLGLPDA